MSTQIRTEIEVGQARQKMKAAALQYHAEKSRPAGSAGELLDARYLYPRDIAPLATAAADTAARGAGPPPR